MTDSDSDGNPNLENLPVGRHTVQLEDDTSYYEKGNNNSRLFFARMQASHSEARSIKKQCAAAARSSPARFNEERMNFDFLRLSIGSSRRSSQVARQAVMQETNGRQHLGEEPKDLGHLSLPIQSRNNVGNAEIQFVLPGAIENFKDREQTVRDLTQPFITGTRDMAADSEILERLAAANAAQRTCTDEKLDRRASSARPEMSRFSHRRSSKRLSSRLSMTPGMDREKSKFLTKNWAVAEAEGDPDMDIIIERPALRFKVLTQFNERFQPAEAAKSNKEAISQAVQEQKKLLKEPDETLHHPVLGWIRHELAITIDTKDQLEVAFPVVVLTILDAVYSKRVRWTEVDWDTRYVRATQKNYVLLQALWKEVNMDSGPDFRRLPPFLRMQAMYEARSQDRLHFLQLMHRWFMQRIPDSDPYNAMGRRRQYYEQCRLMGRPIEFPSWVDFDPDEEEEDAGEGELRLLRRQSLAAAPMRGYTRMPEYQRLMNFLGNEDLPSM